MIANGVRDYWRSSQTRFHSDLRTRGLKLSQYRENFIAAGCLTNTPNKLGEDDILPSRPANTLQGALVHVCDIAIPCSTVVNC